MGAAIPVRIFISHSTDSEDLDLVARLRQHLAPLLNLGRCTLWNITAGTDPHELRRQFLDADLRLLLLSSSYLQAHADLIDLIAQNQGAPSLLVRLRAVDYQPPRHLPIVPAVPVQQHKSLDVALAQVVRAVREKVRVLARPDPDEMERQDRQDRLLGWRVDNPRALDCDRTRQWGTVLDLAQTALDEVVLVPGADDQGHAFFLARVDVGLPELPPRRVEYVPWPEPFPRTKARFAAALADRLDTSEQGLPQRLADLLSEQNLIVLHNTLQPTVADYQALVRYYAEWLPEWLAEARRQGKGSGGLKVFQPIAWHPAGLLDRVVAGPLRLLRGLRAPHWTRLAEQRGRARALIAQLLRQQDRHLPILLLRDLAIIKEDDIRRFCHIIQMPEDRRQGFVDAALGRGKNPDRVLNFILQELDRYLWQGPEDTE